MIVLVTAIWSPPALTFLGPSPFYALWLAAFSGLTALSILIGVLLLRTIRSMARAWPGLNATPNKRLSGLH